MKLNIGCCSDTWGDVRLDLDAVYLRIKSNANIYADAQKIPFQNMSFEETKAWNVLEHLPEWKAAVKEWCRVTEKKLEIEVPIDAGFVKQELIAEIFSLSYPLLMQLPKRRRQHLWQFTSSAIMKELNKNGFSSYLFFERGPLIFRDNNRLVKVKAIRYLREKQKVFNYGYRIIGYRNSLQST
jgi:hypothetical protein